jgi:hypothetical protein
MGMALVFRRDTRYATSLPAATAVSCLLSYCARHHDTVTTPAGGSGVIELQENRASRCQSSRRSPPSRISFWTLDGHCPARAPGGSRHASWSRRRSLARTFGRWRIAQATSGAEACADLQTTLGAHAHVRVMSLWALQPAALNGVRLRLRCTQAPQPVEKRKAPPGSFCTGPYRRGLPSRRMHWRQRTSSPNVPAFARKDCCSPLLGRAPAPLGVAQMG